MFKDVVILTLHLAAMCNARAMLMNLLGPMQVVRTATEVMANT